LSFYPGQTVAETRHKIEAAVAEAVAGDPWFAEHPPRITWDGFQTAGSTVSMDEPSVKLLATWHERVVGSPLEGRSGTGVTDQRYYNFVGIHHTIASPASVPPGRHSLRFQMAKTGDFAGRGTLLIDGESVGEVEIPQTYRAQTSFIGLEVGRAPVPAVSDFLAPFPFTGTIERVVIELGDDQQRDPSAELVAALAQQ
jgi:hypothetical protein